MAFTICWEEDVEAKGPRKRVSVARVTQSGSPDASRGDRLESFCVPSFFIVVRFDNVPISRASIMVSIPESVRKKTKSIAPPALVHYGFATNHAFEWNDRPLDSCFKAVDESLSRFSAEFDLKAAENAVLGLSFVIQLDNGHWVKDFEKDFYVGGGQRSVPCCVEMPFSDPPGVTFACGRMMNLYRANPFWLQPMLDCQSLASCKQETQFVLAEVDYDRTYDEEHKSNREASFVALLLMVDVNRETRASLFGVEGRYAAVRIENGKSIPLHFRDLHESVVCVCAHADSPYDAVRFAVDRAAAITGTFSSRLEKISSPRWQEICGFHKPGVLHSLGFCTWDAFGHEVSEHAVTNAAQWFKRNDIPVGYVIVDDGWQAGGSAGPNHEYGAGTGETTGRPAMSSFGANDKFSGSLRSLVDRTGINVMAWAAIIGYWGGAKGDACGVETRITRGALSKGLHVNAIECPGHWEKRYEIVSSTSGNVEKFFDDYFVESMASKQCVSGVKLDAQSVLEIVCNPNDDLDLKGSLTRYAITASYRRAAARAAELAFPGSVVLNCMACGPETIFSSGCRLSEANVSWRASNDHAFPGITEDVGSVAWHILCNAMTSLLLGEIFPVVDWDMFRAGNTFAEIHAAARIASGGPVYVSDFVASSESLSNNAIGLLRKLTTSSGKILRCANAGKASLECLFRDPRTEPFRILKVFNRTAVLGLLGLFNISSCDEAQYVSGAFAPNDVEDFDRLPGSREYISFVDGAITGAFRHIDGAHRCKVTLPNMSAALVHICPIFRVSERLRFATIGQRHLMNSGASVAGVVISTASCDPPRLQHNVDCFLNDSGELYIWLDDYSLRSLIKVTTLDEAAVVDRTILDCAGLTFLVFSVAPSQKCGVRFVFEECIPLSSYGA